MGPSVRALGVLRASFEGELLGRFFFFYSFRRVVPVNDKDVFRVLGVKENFGLTNVIVFDFSYFFCP